MPSGKVHDKISFLLLPFVVAGSYFLLNKTNYIAIISVSYIFSALMFSGDLDIKSKQSKRWGFFSFIWIPYRWIFPHRSPLTHSVLDGTIIRVIYLFCCAMGFILLGNYLFKTELISLEGFLHITKEWVFNNPMESVLIFAGMLIGSLSHTLTDMIHSSWKRKFKRKK